MGMRLFWYNTQCLLEFMTDYLSKLSNYVGNPVYERERERDRERDREREREIACI